MMLGMFDSIPCGAVNEMPTADGGVAQVKLTELGV